MMRRAFTLVELVIVIALVGILLGLLMPGLRGASEGARTMRCGSNLRQMAMAAFAYANTFRQQLPPAITYDCSGATVRTLAWDWAQESPGLTPGALWGFTDHPGTVQQCPSFAGASTFGADPYTGYNYNTSYLAAEAPFPTSADDCGPESIRAGLPMTQHRRTTTTALFGDGGWRGGANKFMRAPSGNVEGDLSVVYSGAQAFRHQGSTCVVYLDAHVGCPRQCCVGANASAPLLQLMGHPANGFLSADDSAYDPR